MKTFYFNTGVKPFGHSPPITLGKGEVWRGGTKQIPFDCDDVPNDAVFAFACDNPSLPNYKDYIVRDINNSALLSKFAYFKPSHLTV